MTEEINSNTNLSPEKQPEPRNIVALFRQWSAPPVFPGEEDKTRRASMINALLLAGLGFFTLYGFTIPWSTPNVLPATIVVFLMIGLFFIGLRAVRSGNVNTAIYTLIIFGWAIAAVTSAVFGGVISPVFISFVVLIQIAGLMVDSRSAIIVSAATVVYGGILIFLENAGMLSAFSGTSTSFLTRYAFVFFTVTFLIYLSNRNIQESRTKAETSREELEDRHRELDEIRTYLEEEVEQNTRQLERRNRYLETAAQIARDTVASYDLQEMLDQVVSLIATQFGYYQVGLFLIEEDSQWANLKAASSEGGRAMIARNHRLGVGKQGIVGFVTGIGQPRITQDIDLDRIHSVTPELPETRSEMALPLKARGKIIGALDIQDRVPNAFVEEDISALQTLADQVALAIENLRLFQQVEEKQEEMQRIYGDISQKTWLETNRQKGISAYKFSDGKLIPVNDPNESLLSENKLELPIIVRGNKIGSIEIAKQDVRAEWTEDEEQVLSTLSDQLGIALDSARLFNETQLRASTEKIIGDINAEIWESLEINSILRTTAEKLQQSLELPEVSIKMTTPTAAKDLSGNGNPLDASESN
jgi:GAF domain-containing protein